MKLHRLLCNAEQGGYSDIISWLPSGEAFRIHDADEMIVVLRTHFNISKFKSFLRQLQNYGFHRFVCGARRGICSHSKFLKDRPDLCNQISRGKGNKSEEPCPTTYMNTTTITSEDGLYTQDTLLPTILHPPVHASASYSEIELSSQTTLSVARAVSDDAIMADLVPSRTTHNHPQMEVFVPNASILSDNKYGGDETSCQETILNMVLQNAATDTSLAQQSFQRQRRRRSETPLRCSILFQRPDLWMMMMNEDVVVNDGADEIEPLQCTWQPIEM